MINSFDKLPASDYHEAIMQLIRRFEKNLQSHKLILRGDKVFVACSGGPDSVALFYLLNEIRAAWNLRLGLLHFNHGLRGRDAERDMLFVKNLAKKFVLPVYCAEGKVARNAKRDCESLEEAARKARYHFFLKVAKQRRIPKIAFAHTQDDQAETILMRVFQGTGLRGLSGIQRRLKIGNATLVRPLLDFSKQELLDYLKGRRISFCRDLTNQSVRFVRNRIRRKLVPWLKREFNPRVVAAISRLANIASEENQLLAQLEEDSFKTVCRRRKAKIFMNRQRFSKLAPPLQFRLLQRALQKVDPKSGIDFDAWQTLRTELHRKKFRHSFPRDIDLFLSPSRLVICKKFTQAN